MKKTLNILCSVFLSAWFTVNAKVLDYRELRGVQTLLAQQGHVTQLREGVVVTDGAGVIIINVKTPRGSTIEIIGDGRHIREIKESY